MIPNVSFSKYMHTYYTTYYALFVLLLQCASRKTKLKTVEIFEYVKTNLAFEGAVLVSLSSNDRWRPQFDSS